MNLAEFNWSLTRTRTAETEEFTAILKALALQHAVEVGAGQVERDETLTDFELDMMGQAARKLGLEPDEVFETYQVYVDQELNQT